MKPGKALCCLLALFLLTFTVLAEDPVISYTKEIPGIGSAQCFKIGANILVETNFNIELLFIGAATGSGFTHRGYVGPPAEFRDLVSDYFGPYQGTPAAKKLYDLSNVETSNPNKKYNNALVSQVLAYDELLARSKRFKPEASGSIVTLLRRFAEQSNARAYFQQNLGRYNRLVEEYAAQYRFNHVEQLEAFFGDEMKGGSFLVVLSPAMSGGQAVEMTGSDGSPVYVNIMNSASENRFRILNLLYHETAHNFLTPILQRQRALIHKYESAAGVLGGGKIGYPTFASSLNETMARAITVCLLAEHHGKEIAAINLYTELRQGWTNLEEITLLILNKYLPDRRTYPDFERFLPVILEYLEAKNAGQPIDLGPAGTFTILPVYVVGSRERAETVNRYLPFVTQGSAESQLPKFVNPSGSGPALFVIAYTPDQKGRQIDGSFCQALGYDYEELIRETERQGIYQKVCRKGEWITLVFGAKDAAGLNNLLRGFAFADYMVEFE